MKGGKHHTPPVLAAALLGWLLKDDWQTPLGDFEEYYNLLAHERGVRTARWWYRRQLFWMLPERLAMKLYWTVIMLKNYLVIAYRSLLKNKVPSFINLFGLSVAIGCSIVVFLFIHSKLVEDRFHEHGDTIFMVEHETLEEGQPQRWGHTPMPLGPALEADFNQVVRTVRVSNWRSMVEAEEQAFNEGIRFVDGGFFDMFTFPLKYGSPEAFADPGAAILSEETAIKFFGAENPVGRQITISEEKTPQLTLTVVGVAEAFPPSTDFNFRVLVNYERLLAMGIERLDDWATFTSATFVQVTEPDDIDAIAQQMDRYLDLQHAASEEWTITTFAFKNLFDLTRTSDNVRRTIAGSVPWAPVIVLSVVAVFLLLLSCFNYMNIALATVRGRLKEIGVRKVMGGNRIQLVSQFLSENILLCLFSLVVGIVLAQAFLVPAFNDIAGQALSVFQAGNGDFWVFLFVLLVGIGLVSGAYPAFYISSFQPVAIFRGQHEKRGRKLFTQAFLTFQFVLAFITMVASVSFTLNGIDQERRDWGYDRAHTLVIPLEESAHYEVLSAEARQLTGVESLSGARHHIGLSRAYGSVDIEAEPLEVVRFEVGPNYLETMGLRLKAGQFLPREASSDAAQTIVINETFAAQQGWTTPIGQTVRIDSAAYAVTGVIADFHYDDFSDAIEPAYFVHAAAEEYQYLTMRLTAGTGVQTVTALEQVWTRMLPETTYEYFFQDSVFDGFYEETRGITRIFTFVALMALLISCMGLFGLAAQNIANRMKEISIRKVLGASVAHVTRLVNSRFLLLLLLAAVIATPLSKLAIEALMDSVYTYHTGVTPMAFILTYVLVFLTAAITISTQVYKVIHANPAEVLRNE